jgi:hypothetical protein
MLVLDRTTSRPTAVNRPAGPTACNQGVLFPQFAPEPETNPAPAAPQRVDSDNVVLHFRVSMNEEHAFMTVCDGAREPVDLGERTHHYCLLTLARRRLLDARAGLDASSQGWVPIDQLCSMLGIEHAYLNILVFRARSQLARVLRRGAGIAAVVERRRGELRFGDLRFRIERGSQIEGESDSVAAP